MFGSQSGGNSTTTSQEPVGAETADAAVADREDGPAPVLPSATGLCPTFTSGTLAFTVAGVSRTARVWVDEAAASAHDGPLVFYWHATGSAPVEAEYGLGTTGIASITSLGGIVVAPVYAGAGRFPWVTDVADHYALLDEVVGCAEQEIGIDARQIHSVGMSAGGLFTTALSLARSNLLASVAVYSGGARDTIFGGEPDTFADTNNKFAALVFHGGSSDNIYGFDFQIASQKYVDVLRNAGHFALLCDHAGGHSIPSDGPAAVIPFFLAHRFGAPAPYATSLPASVPAYCKP